MSADSLFNAVFEDFDLADFLAPDATARQNINQLIETISKNDTKPSLTLIYGKKAVGKTHLLKALFNRHHQNGLVSLYLSLKQEISSNLNLLTDGIDLLCLDDCQAIRGNNQSLMLYDLINKNKIHLILAINQHPNQLEVLNDLKTRMQSGTVIKINPLTDSQIFQALELKCRAKGIALNDRVLANFLLQTKRNMHEISDNLEKLAIFAKGKKITSKMVNQYFAVHNHKPSEKPTAKPTAKS